MKQITSLVLAVIASVFFFASCKDKAAEKRIAELESRLAQLETNKGGATAAATPGLNPTPTTTEATVKPEGPLPVAQFETQDHDFGSVNEGKKVTFKYAVKNTGEAPLVIQTAQPSCGCTVPDWTHEPIPVGGTGFVTAEFDTNGKQGIQNKTITVTTNSWPQTTTLRFKAMVLPKADLNGPTK
jgi:hypothetical protein